MYPEEKVMLDTVQNIGYKLLAKTDTEITIKRFELEMEFELLGCRYSQNSSAVIVRSP